MLLALPLTATATASSIADLEFELTNLALNPGPSAEIRRAASIGRETGRVAADFVVEIKGPQQKLTIEGVETLARQISDALETLDADS